jgi:uncharacterized SAM-binding protein YcdF (DUF218 family)
MMERGDSISLLSEWTLRVNLVLPDWQLQSAKVVRARRERGIRLMRESNQMTAKNARGVIGLASDDLKLRMAGLICGMCTMKTLVTLIQPLSVIWLLLGSWVIWRVWRKTWRELALPGLAWLLLTVMSCTPMASLLMAALEKKYPPVDMAALPVADAIVCLGGGAEPSLVEPTGLHLKSGADRLSTALFLLAQAKAPILVLGGGGYEEAGVMHSEADQVVEGLKKAGINTAAMRSLGVCADTHDEAHKMAEWMKEKDWKRVLLVTSAYHMPRSVGTFEKAGVSVLAVPCNYVSSVHRVGDLQWLHLPHSDAFSVFGGWFHELIGTWVYRWRGWM